VELRALDPRVGHASLVIFEHLLPTFSADDYALRRRLHVNQKDVAARHHSERSLVEAVEHVARLLKLYGEEERARGVHARALDAGRVAVAAGYLRRPEAEAVVVGLTAEEVSVLLLDEEGRGVNIVRELGDEPRRVEDAAHNRLPLSVRDDDRGRVGHVRHELPARALDFELVFERRVYRKLADLHSVHEDVQHRARREVHSLDFDFERATTIARAE